MTQQSASAAIPDAIPTQDESTSPRGIAWGRIIVWIIIAGILGLLGRQLIVSGLSQPTAGPAPDFSLTSYDGQQINLSDLRGQVVVVNFWASWCVPCIEEAPELEATWQTYKDQGVMLVGVDYLDSQAKGLAFIEEHGLTYPNGADLRQEISDAYRITGVPETFVIDPQGNITFHVALPITRDVLSREIEKAMRQGSG